MGNSEVGHLNLGAGAIVPQDLARIDKAVEDGTLAENEVLQAALQDAPRVHLIGLVSDGGVHSSDRHLKALIELAARRRGRPRVHRRPRHRPEGRREVPRRRRELGRARRQRRRPLLRDGPRQALGPGPEGLRPARARHGRASRRTRPRRRRATAYERERDRRVHHADDRRRGGLHPAGRLRDRVQLPARPDARDHAGADRSGRSTRSIAAAPR